MQLNAARRGNRVKVQLIGELDHHSANDVRAKLDTLIADNSVKELLLDLSGISFMDSSGLGVVLGRYRLLQQRGGRLLVHAVPQDVDRLFKMSGLYALVDRA